MRKFWVDFQGYCIVESDSDDIETISTKFFENIYPPVKNAICNEIYEITGIEEVQEGDEG